MFNNLVPFSRNMQNFENLFNKLFDDSFDFSNFPNEMKVDIKDNDNEYVLEAEIPGVNKEQINIDYQKNYLTIGVENKNELNEEKESYIRKERSYKKMIRSFYIENINDNNISASYENGILKVNLPKDKNVNPKRKIDIQ